jgi:hypothetical protein
MYSKGSEEYERVPSGHQPVGTLINYYLFD